MEGLSEPRVMKSVLERHGLSLHKSLGQNFLINPHIAPRMAAVCGVDKNSGVLEIGPGIGVLTHELAKVANKVVSVEIDGGLLPVLSETLSEHKNVTIVHGDILKLDLETILQEQFPNMPVYCCANLPYYLTSPIIMFLLENRLPFEAITVMVQKEAALRLCAEPGTRNVGAVSFAVRYFSEPSLLFEVSHGSFFPAPKVDSAVIQMKVKKHPELPPPAEKLFFRTVKAAFMKRRKTFLNAISSGLSYPAEQLRDCAGKADIAPTARIEQITQQQLFDFVNFILAIN